jgi:glycosyltransferase involved in cell wall biosynthesis
MQKVKMILTNRFDPDMRVYKEAKYLVSKGYDVEILCWDREADYKDKETENIDGIKIKRFFPYSNYGSGYKQIKAYFNFITEIKKYLKDENYEYIHCHDLDGALAGYLSKNINTEMIFDMHEFYEGQGKKQKIRLIIRLLVNFLHDKSQAVIYLNDIQKTTMKSANLKKILYLPNYPEIENFKNSDKTKNDLLRISYIGSVRQYFELRNLMDSCKDMEGVHVAIHGGGVSYNKLKELENEYSNVEITGKYQYSNSSELYSQTDILYAVYDSSIENWKKGYPIKLYEAILTKTPIIVCKGTALEKFVNENDIGFTVDGRNIEEIRSLIEYIKNNRQILDEKTRNIEKIQYNYSWETAVINLDKIYK